MNITRVLDVGTGACGVVRRYINHGMDVHGVEAVSFPLEDRCADLLQNGVVQKAPLDALPFDDADFQLVTAFNVLEYIPTDKLDLVLQVRVVGGGSESTSSPSHTAMKKLRMFGTS